MIFEIALAFFQNFEDDLLLMSDDAEIALFLQKHTTQWFDTNEFWKVIGVSFNKIVD